MGAYSIVSRDIALGRHPGKVVGENLKVVLLTFPLGLLACLVVSDLLYGSDGLLVFGLIGVGYLLLSRTSLLLAAVQNTVQVKVPVIAVEAVVALSLLSLGGYGMAFGYSLFAWAVTYALIGVSGALVAGTVLRRSLGDIKAPFPSMGRISEGLVFSMGNSFQYLYLELDKILLFRYANSALTGVYAASTRIVTVALMPIGAVYSLFYPRFMQVGHDRAALSALLHRVVLIAAGYGLIMALCFIALSNFLPGLLGEGYARVRTFLLYLSGVVFLQVMQTPFADALTGRGHQAVRTLLQGSASVVALGAGLLFIPGDPTSGVIKTVFTVHGYLLLAYVLSYGLIMRRKKEQM